MSDSEHNHFDEIGDTAEAVMLVGFVALIIYSLVVAFLI